MGGNSTLRPHPNPLPQERGRLFGVLGLSGVCLLLPGSSELATIPDASGGVSGIPPIQDYHPTAPSPGGEGWGEGEKLGHYLLTLPHQPQNG